jgi:hypothetical protein
MHKNAMKYNKTQSKWCINKHEASKIIDMFETYQYSMPSSQGRSHTSRTRNLDDDEIHEDEDEGEDQDEEEDAEDAESPPHPFA